MNHVICVSGGFDPLHSGHLAMFRQASEQGRLTVILNSDEWLLRKKGFIFMPWQDRANIIGELRCVADVSRVDDTDGTVCEALERLKPRYFVNGGDRKLENTPELAACNRLGIEMLWNIGGGKTDSSSDIAKRALVYRSWGTYVTLDEGEGYKVKKIMIAPKQSISLQYHHHRSEYWYMVGSDAQVQLGNEVFMVAKNGPPVIVGREVVHRLANTGDKPLAVIEIQSGQYLGEDDIVRLEQKILVP